VIDRARGARVIPVEAAGPSDLYAVLGVTPAASLAELRRAYRRLALAHHPDRAGPGSAPVFARIAEAYRMLSDPTARAAYDAHVFQRRRYSSGAGSQADARAGGSWSVSSIAWSASWQRPVIDRVARLSGPVDALLASGAIRAASDGSLELFLRADEAAAGGTAVLELPLDGPCPTCGGVARKGGVWCCRCEYRGRITEPVPVRITIPPAATDGMAATAHADRPGVRPPRVSLRLAAN
jgi:molecular chaperone DnaJ